MKRRIVKKKAHRAFRTMMQLTCRLWDAHDRWTMMVQETPEWRYTYTMRIATDEFRLARHVKQLRRTNFG
jgi:hypothetical protein